MRIVIFNWKDMAHPHAGGAEVWTHEIASRLVSWGHHVTWFAPSVKGLADHELTEGGYFIQRRGNRLSVYRAARRWWHTESPAADLVIDEINTRPFQAAQWTGTPTVQVAHQVAREIWFSETPWPVAVVGRYLAEPWWLHRCRNVPTFTVSQSSADSLRSYGMNQVHVLPQASHLGPIPESLPHKEPELTFVMCGRLVKAKRPDDAIHAVELVAERLGAAKLWVVGSGPYQVKRSDSSIVEFLGQVDHHEKFELMARAHALVATSVREGWGLVVSEAASVGTLAVTYPSPGLVDSVTASGGVLADACTPQALAEAICSNIDLVRTGAPTGHGTVSWDQLAVRFGRDLERVLSKPGSIVPVSEAAAK